MFGLCLPTGTVMLEFTNGEKRSIECVDLLKPIKHIMESEDVLKWVKYYGYENINNIIYKRSQTTIKVNMADYYYENADKLKEVV